MNKVNRDKNLRKKLKIRSRAMGSFERPRLSVFKSNTNIYVQAIDDLTGATLAAASSLSIKNDKVNKTELSKKVGALIAASLKKLKIDSAVFDRNGYVYHGRVKALADSVRENGINI